MENTTNFDVAVVGASIAGTTAATFFARQGKSVALVEARANPEFYKVLCTHYIQASGTPTIQRLGVADAVEEAGGLRNSVALWTRWGWMDHQEGLPYGYSMSRSKLDPILRKNAAATPGVELKLGHSVTGLLRSGDRVTGIETSTPDGASSRITASLVVGADGRHSRVGDLSGTGVRTMANKRVGYFAYYEGVEFKGDRAGFWMLDSDVLYVFPNEDGQTILAAMFDETKLEWFKKDFSGNLKRVFERLPDAPDLSKAKRVSKVLGEIDYPNMWRKAGPGGVAFAGDAMVTGDPLWGVGCGWALQTGEWLAEIAGPALGDPAALDSAVAAYRAKVRKELLGHFLMTSEYSRVRRYNPAEKILFSAGTKNVKMARILQGFGSRTVPVTKILSPLTMARAVAVNLRHRSNREQVARNRDAGRAAVTPPQEAVSAEEVSVQ